MKGIEVCEPRKCYRVTCARCQSVIETTEDDECVATTNNITFNLSTRCPICEYSLGGKQFRIGPRPTIQTAEVRLMWRGESESIAISPNDSFDSFGRKDTTK